MCVALCGAWTFALHTRWIDKLTFVFLCHRSKIKPLHWISGKKWMAMPQNTIFNSSFFFLFLFLQVSILLWINNGQVKVEVCSKNVMRQNKCKNYWLCCKLSNIRKIIITPRFLMNSTRIIESAKCPCIFTMCIWKNYIYSKCIPSWFNFFKM